MTTKTLEQRARELADAKKREEEDAREREAEEARRREEERAAQTIIAAALSAAEKGEP